MPVRIPRLSQGPQIEKIHDHIFPSLASFQSSNILKTTTTITNHSDISENCETNVISATLRKLSSETC